MSPTWKLPVASGVGRFREPRTSELRQYGRQPAPTAIARAASQAREYAILRSRIVSPFEPNLRQQGFQRASTETSVFEVMVRISSTFLSIAMRMNGRRCRDIGLPSPVSIGRPPRPFDGGGPPMRVRQIGRRPTPPSNQGEEG